MPSDIRGHTLSWEELSQASSSRLQPCFQDLYLHSIEIMWLVQNNVLSMTYAKSCKNGHFSKIKISCEIIKTFINLEVKQHKKYHLTLREGFP